MARTANPSGLVKLGDTNLTVRDPAEDVRGLKVLDRAGEQIGTVDSILIDERDAKVRFLEVGSGGFLGIGQDKVLIPVDVVTRVDQDHVHIDRARSDVADAPRYAPELVDESAYWNELYTYYGYTPFWAANYAYPAYPYYQPVPAASGRATSEARGERRPTSEHTFVGEGRVEIIDERDQPRSEERSRSTDRAVSTAGTAPVPETREDISPMAETADRDSIEHVRKGMRVVDASGDEIGTVDFVKMGDPDAPTLSGTSWDGGFVQDFAEVFGWDAEPDLPPALAAQFLRRGFIKIDSSGLFGSDRYAPADQILGVSGDTVRLRAREDELPEES